MKILVAITSFGADNDQWLERLIQEYGSMVHKVDIVVLSNIARPVPPGVELIVGLPTKDPWSLPFAHKRILASRVDHYDLFIYSENDILITEKNIEAFLRATAVLHKDEIAGFLRVETDRTGRRYYPDVHSSFHWDPDSLVQRGGRTFAFFTCEHSGCFMLTRQQLQRAIDSGGFSVRPHSGKYDLACTAATDPYTQCGFRKMLCISELGLFLVSHLSNKYVGTSYDLDESDFDRQMEALYEVLSGKRTRARLLNTDTRFPLLRFSKSYYEPPRADILELIPAHTKSVVSVGCGWGAMEERLIGRGIQVKAIPMDSVISACAEARGIGTLSPDFESAWRELANRRFDCVFLANVLHLVPDPLAIIRECARLLSKRGHIVLTVPNFNYLPLLWGRIRGNREYRNPGNSVEGCLNLTTRSLIREWLHHSGVVMDRVIEVVPKSWQGLSRRAGVVRPLLAAELIVTGQKVDFRELSERRSESESHSVMQV
jgi:2-polyprenyl-3-methyl-5-hydroxy-6-metoxy-1,4-benzoquinol methylase